MYCEQTSEASTPIHNVAATAASAADSVLAADESKPSSTASVYEQPQHEQHESDNENDVHVRDRHHNDSVRGVTKNTTNQQQEQQKHGDESEHDRAADGENDQDYANGHDWNEFDGCSRSDSPRYDNSNRMSVGSSSSSRSSGDGGGADLNDDERPEQDGRRSGQGVPAAAGDSQQQQTSSSSSPSSSARRRGGVVRAAIGQDGFPPWYLVDRKPCEWEGYRDADNDNENLPLSRMQRHDGYEIKKNAVKDVKTLAKRLKAIKQIEDQLSFLNAFVFFQDIFQGNHRLSQHNASDTKKKGYIVSNPMSCSKPWGRHQGEKLSLQNMILIDLRVAVPL